MKYIRKFNEDNSTIDKLRYFCNTNLSYLVDNGFVIHIHQIKEQFVICIDRINTFFNYSSIVDDFIPFLFELKSNYNLVELESFNLYGDGPHNVKIDNNVYNIDDVINNDILLNDDSTYGIYLSVTCY